MLLFLCVCFVLFFGRGGLYNLDILIASISDTFSVENNFVISDLWCIVDTLCPCLLLHIAITPFSLTFSS